MASVRVWTHKFANPSQTLLILLLYGYQHLPSLQQPYVKENPPMEKRITYFATSVDVRYTWDTPIQEFWIAFNDEVQQVNDQPHSIEMVHHPNGLSNVKGRSKKYDLVRQIQKSHDPAWTKKQMKQETRVDLF